MADKTIHHDLLLHFVPLDPFKNAWADLSLTDDDLRALEIAIMADPTRAPVMQGTGGLRKIRFAPLRSGQGKSGGVRVCYVHLPAHATVILVLAYPKSMKDNLNANEKKQIKTLIEQIQDYLALKKKTQKDLP